MTEICLPDTLEFWVWKQKLRAWKKNWSGMRGEGEGIEVRMDLSALKRLSHLYGDLEFSFIRHVLGQEHVVLKTDGEPVMEGNVTTWNANRENVKRPPLYTCADKVN